jgi:toxin ParE1/3/4
MVQIKWTLKSKQDLKDIYDYIAFDSKYYAKKTVLILRQKTEILKTHIDIGKIVPDFGNENVRELLEGNYRIIYKTISDTKVEIITVFHSKRDLSKFILL